MEHRHGDCMMSLRWELLPRKLRDVIAPETVAMVTEVTGRKGVVISRMAGNAPINGNKEDVYLCISVPGRAACDSKSPFLSWYSVLSLGFHLVCVILLTYFYRWMLLWTSRHNKMGKNLPCPVLLCSMGSHLSLLFAFSYSGSFVSVMNSPAQLLSRQMSEVH